MFNRRHYEFVAQTIKDERHEMAVISNDRERDAAINALTNLAWRFADAFAEDNDKFDADKFINATVEGVTRRVSRG